MRPLVKIGLDKRILVSTMSVVALVLIVFLVVIGYVSEKLEHRILDRLVIKEYGEIKQRLAVDPQVRIPSTPELRVWVTTHPQDRSLPEQLRDLSSGIFYDVSMDGAMYIVLKESAQEQYVTLAYEITLVETWEHVLERALFGSVILGPLFVLWLSFLFTRRLARPVVELAEKLSALDPAEKNVSLGEAFHGQEVGAIANAFDRYQERIELMVEREQSFTAAASHELRTPLAVISASTDLLESSDNVSEHVLKHTRRIANATAMMNELVSSLLALARERKQKLTSPLHLQPVIEDAMANCQSQLVNKDVTLTLECDAELTMWISTGDVLVVVGNLLQNAVRNTEFGKITVSCDASRLVVKDTGRGMPAEFAAQIFDKHVQAQDSHGVGLGLHIVKRLCDRYGWRIDLQSTLGEGTTVAVYWSSTE